MGYAGKVWELKEIRYSAHATTAAASISVKTDMPSGGTIERAAIAIATSATRTTNQSPLDGIEARQLQVRFTPGASGILRVYKATVLGRPIGVYLDGSKADFYETQPIALGG